MQKKLLGLCGMDSLFSGIYKSKKIFITGHTGFKGSWLSYWLLKMGANVKGYALTSETTPNHYSILQLDKDMKSDIGDIRDYDKLYKSISEFQPGIVFHLAAQPLVRESYAHPLETLETNIMGTAKVLEACKNCESVRAIVNITSDKCYENIEKDYAYIETDPMGGYDPYSASKGCAELVSASYRRSFFNIDEYGIHHNVLLANCRAGNVIGGGDWATDRLIPDIVKSSVNNQKVLIRNPRSIRPWQHVLEPLHGYLRIGEMLLEGKKVAAQDWNFGPEKESILTVEDVVQQSKEVWGIVKYDINSNPKDLHEANLLMLDCSKARRELGWKPVWNFKECINYTISWYKDYYENKTCNTDKDLNTYINYLNKNIEGK